MASSRCSLLQSVVNLVMTNKKFVVVGWPGGWNSKFIIKLLRAQAKVRQVSEGSAGLNNNNSNQSELTAM